MTEPQENNQSEQGVAPEADNTGPASPTAAELEIGALKDQLLRAMAEAENTRKRAIKEREDAMKFGTAALAKEMLGAADNLRRALAAAGELKDEAAKNFVAGVEATERQLLAAFERAGIRKMEPLDHPFDPNFHQAMIEIEAPDKPAGTVVQVMQDGYTIHGRLLREALVGVTKGGPAATKVDTKA